MKDIVRLDYEGMPIDFTEDAFFNATQAAARYAKRPSDWLRLPSTQEYVKASGDFLHLDYEQMVMVVHGGSSPGTWLHPELVIEFAQWLDIRFKIWCNTQIRLLLTGKTQEALANVEALKHQIAAKEIEHKAELKALKSEHDEDLEIAAHKINMPSRYWLKDVIKAQKQADLAEGAKRYAEVTAEVQAEVLAVLRPMLPDLPRRERRDLEAALEWMDKTLRDFKRGRFLSTSY